MDHAEYDDEVDRITSGSLLEEFFYYEVDDYVVALADSSTLKEAGDGALPGFVCNADGDFYNGNRLEYGCLSRLHEWVHDAVKT